MDRLCPNPTPRRNALLALDSSGNASRPSVCKLLLTALALLAFAPLVSARTLILTGVGTTGFGGTGEEITVTVELNTEDFVYVPVANEIFHYFEPIRPVPFSVVGSVNGPYDVVSPIDRFLALELSDGGGGSADQVAIDVRFENTSSTLFTSFCRFDDCFDGDVTPFTPTELFDLFEESVTDTDRWQFTSALSSIVVGPNNSRLTFGGPMEWTLFNPDAPEVATIAPVFDVAYQQTVVPALVEGEESLRIGGFPDSTSFPVEMPVMEFSLDSVPQGAEVLSATLTIDTFVSSGPPRVEVIGYAGDGVASLRDGTIAGPVLATTEPLSASATDVVIDLDPIYIESLLGGASHVGLRLASLDAFDYVSFDSTEETFPGSTPPTLTIEYLFDAPPIPGDFNGDGSVDLLDLDILGRNFGRMGDATFADGDANGDGNVDLLDLDTMGLNFGVPASETVPEPAAGLLALLACAATGVCRSRSISSTRAVSRA